MKIHNVIQVALVSAGAFLASPSDARADYLVGGEGGHITFIESDAVLSLSEHYDDWNAPAGVIDGDVGDKSGAVFRMDEGRTSVYWKFGLATPSPEITGLELWTRVGGLVDNGVKDFTIAFYSGTTQDILLGQQSFVAELEDGWQEFTLTNSYTGVTGFIVTFTSNYEISATAEVNEIRLVTPVPEPGSIVLAGVAVAMGVLFRRKTVGQRRP